MPVSNALEVLYNVSNLELAFGTDLTRTGIFRATEACVRAALAHPAVTTRFAAPESTGHWSLTCVPHGR